MTESRVIQKPYDGITKDDIDALAADEVREGRTPDHKKKLPGNADKEKQEFLAVEPAQLLMPAFDAMGQASEWSHYFHYDNNGAGVSR